MDLHQAELKKGLKGVDEKDEARTFVKGSLLTTTLSEVVERIFNDIDRLDSEIVAIKTPTGTRENPARTCRDIFLGHPDYKDGTNNFSFSEIKSTLGNRATMII